MRCTGWICIALLGAACSTRNDAKSEQAYVDKEIASLERALAAASESTVIVECVSLRASMPRLPAPTVSKIERLCDVEAPRLLLGKAIADVTEKNAAHPDMVDINCVQLFVKDAFDAIARHPTVDPELDKLVAEYKRLCPAEAAKLGPRATP